LGRGALAAGFPKIASVARFASERPGIVIHANAATAAAIMALVLSLRRLNPTGQLSVMTVPFAFADELNGFLLAHFRNVVNVQLALLAKSNPLVAAHRMPIDGARRRYLDAV